MSPGWRGIGIFQSGSSVFVGRDNGKGGGFLNFFPLDMMRVTQYISENIFYQKLQPHSESRVPVS